MPKEINNTCLLTVHEKYEIILYAENNSEVAHSKIAELFKERFKKNVCRRSISNYIKIKDKIKAACLFNSTAKNCSSSKKYPIIDDELFKWIEVVEEKNAFYNENILKKRALEIAKSHNISDFKASNGWIHRFKTRYNIKERNLCGESGKAKKEDYEDFYKTIELKMKGYDPKNIFNLDETSLFYKARPSKSIISKIRKGVKNYKDRITVMFCCNSDGSEKLAPFIIGKYKSPRAFKNFDIKKYCNYTHSQKAWMTRALFNGWLLEFDERMQKEKRKIMIILDNCSAHTITYKPKNIEIQFLPKNSTFVSQPLDLGIIASFKTRFSNIQSEQILLKLDKVTNAEKLYKDLNVKDAIYFTYIAWKEITPEIIQNCWKAAGYAFLKTSLKENTTIVDKENEKKSECEKNFVRINPIDPPTADEMINLDFPENFIALELHDTIMTNKVEEVMIENSTELIKDDTLDEKFGECENKPDENEIDDIEKLIEMHCHLKKFMLKKIMEDDYDHSILDHVKKYDDFLLKERNKKKYKSILDYFNK